jgi:hypothetical protein
VDAVLHGHRHLALTLRLGQTRLIGVGSATATPTANINNQFNFIVIGESVTRFRLIEDAQSEVGTHWIPAREPW